MRLNQLLSFIMICLFVVTQGQAQYNIPAPAAPSAPVPGSSGTSVPKQSRQATGGMSVYDNDQTAYQQKQDVMTEIYREVRALNKPKFEYKLSSYAGNPATQHYNQAFEELQKMAQTEKADLKRAVFVVENAYFENKLSYEAFLKRLDMIMQICQSKLKNKKQPDNLDKIMAIFSYFTDTSAINVAGYEGKYTHYPVSYDFEDFYGREDHTKMFVSKLLKYNSGNCHSLPLLFLIVAQELGAEAFMTYAPQHSYVRFKDKRGNWYNIELTNNMFTSDAFILESGYIKSQAIKSRIFMDTISQYKVLSECFFDLGRGYAHKFGIDEFVERCSDKALEINPDDIYALQLKSDYQTELANYVLKKKMIRTRQQLEGDSIAKEIVDKSLELYEKIDSKGFEQMPKEAYEKWLGACKEEKNRREHTNKVRMIDTQLR